MHFAQGDCKSGCRQGANHYSSTSHTGIGWSTEEPEEATEATERPVNSNSRDSNTGSVGCCSLYDHKDTLLWVEPVQGTSTADIPVKNVSHKT